jgi:hypothetical protein
MKRILTVLLAFALIATLAACGGALGKPVNGTYKSDDGILSQTWTFSGSDKITLSYGLVSSSGTYKVDGETLTVESELFGQTTTSSYTITEITKTSFFIDGTKFIKQ